MIFSQTGLPSMAGPEPALHFTIRSVLHLFQQPAIQCVS